MGGEEAGHELSLDAGTGCSGEHAEFSLEGACLREPLVEEEDGEEEESSGLFVAFFDKESLTEPDGVLS